MLVICIVASASALLLLLLEVGGAAEPPANVAAPAVALGGSSRIAIFSFVEVALMLLVETQPLK